MSNQNHTNDRAEARRRNRLAAKERAEQEALGITPEAPAAATASAATPPATGGLGFRAALSTSAGNAPILDDLAHLPTLVRTRAFLVPLVVVVATTVFALQPGMLTSNIAQLGVQAILLPPVFVIAFLGGMLTRRGAWLLGGVFGVMTYIASIVVGEFGTITEITDGNPVRVALETIIKNLSDPKSILVDLSLALLGGILAGAFAGWYSRFLRAMSPNQPTERDRRRMEAERRKGKR